MITPVFKNDILIRLPKEANMTASRKLLHVTILLLGAFCLLHGGSASASVLIPEQIWLPGECIPQFVEPLPVFGPAGFGGEGVTIVNRVDALKNPFLTVTMKETERQVLPNFTSPPGCPAVNIQPTRVWAYETSNTLTKKVLGPAFWPAVTLEARRFIPTVVTYVNQLPEFRKTIDIQGVGLDPKPGVSALVQGLVTVDQTIHWADPLECMMNPKPGCTGAYTGPVPAVVHLHGGEVPSSFDGGPDAWFTPASNWITGPAYNTLDKPGPGKAIYAYPNWQEPGTPWIHDHALGATRTNVYSGLAAFYFIRDPLTEPKNLPSGPYEIEMAIQDRQFDTNSQLFFPDGSGPTDCSDELGNKVPCSNLNGPPPNQNVHPFWIPEFIGDVVVVNGSPWPYLQVEPRRYRFRIIEGSNARFYNLNFGAPTYVIGRDDAYLDIPVKVLASGLLIAPGQRADIIVDFTRLSGPIIVTNNANVPYPDGLSPLSDQPQMAQIMQFQVTLPLNGSDTSCDPSKGQCGRPSYAKTVRLTDGNGSLAPGVTIDKVRQLTLKEVPGPGGPLEVLVNNTKWDGRKSPSIAAEFSDGISELPRVGSTELWEIINLTVDAHPMHTHLAQFQILDRQVYTADYPATWEKAFGHGPAPLLPGCVAGQFCPGYGPPLSYSTKQNCGVTNGIAKPEVVGGNPCVDSYLSGTPNPPAQEEAGWNDTAIAMPGQVLRIVVRFAPTSTPTSGLLKAKPGLNSYIIFDPTKGPGYVWHCHIIDHEDNEMMRPYKVTK
jgi:FtsP/CotA-like multicopper oxidase with cupredoxin domain